MVFLLFTGWTFWGCLLSEAEVTDSYLENFENRGEGESIDGYDHWQVSQGNAGQAQVEYGVTVSGSGKGLVLGNSLVPLIVRRPQSYGDITPAWISFQVMSHYSAQAPGLPSRGIGAVSLNYNGKVIVNDGKAWVNTGQTWNPGVWYDVIMKVKFETHTFDLYFTQSNVPSPLFIPVKTDLKFIDASVNYLSALDFYGAYSASHDGSVYIDNVSVTYIDRLQITSAPKKLLVGAVSGPVIVQLQDSLSEPQTAVSDVSLELKTSSPSGRFSLSPDNWQEIHSVIIPKGAQSALFYYKDDATGKPTITVSEYPGRGYTEATQMQEITSVSTFFDLEFMSPQVAGRSFNVKITAKDPEGNVNENFSGTVNLSASYVAPGIGTFSLVPDSVSGFKYGVVESVVSYPDCGIITISAADSENPLKFGVSSQILFLPASLSLNTEKLKQIIGRPFNLSLTARNAAGVVAPNYKGNVKLLPVAVSPADVSGGEISPKAVEGDSFINGVAEVPVSYNLYGRIQIKGQDAFDNTKQGISAEIDFLPKKVTLHVTPPPVGRDFFYIGEPVSLTAAVEDDAGNPVANFAGMVELISNNNLVVPLNYIFTDKDAGKHVFSANSLDAGKYIVTVKCDEAGLTADSEEITVKNAVIQVIDATSPVGTGQIIIQIVDEFGQVIRGENSLSLRLKAKEENENNSVVLPSGDLIFTDGRVVIPVSDSEAEIVDLFPSSEYKIGMKKGSITFGRTGKSGISTQMWRELKKKSNQ